jgi:hypothetical protein
LSSWWLPNEEGRPRLLKQVRNFLTTKPSDEKGEDLRDMKGIFSALSLSDTSSPESSQSAQERPALSRQSSSKLPITEEEYNSELDMLDVPTSAHGVYGDSPEFEWS